MSTSEGFCWTPEDGLKAGLPSTSVIGREQYFADGSKDDFDVIVLGAGYTGLVAARDLATQGRRVLLLEARDRIGGRTWHANIDGFNYEMGGTWVHWHMPHVYREISFYGLQDDFIITQTAGGKKDYFTLNVDGVKRDLSHEDELALFAKTWGTFCDVDGTALRDTIPFPFDSMRNADKIKKWDRLSCQDRLSQLKDRFTKEEMGMLKAILLQMGGGPLEEMGFLDAMRWWALGGWTGTGLNDIGLTTRLRSGQSFLARKVFEHAQSTGKLSYSFSTPVASIAVENNGWGKVTSRQGQSWAAKRVVCTIPLNVLSDISFTPPLPRLKAEAVQIGQTNRENKIHADVAGPDLISWTAMATPGEGFICALADKLTPRGDTHLVLFGPKPDYQGGIHLKDSIEQVKEGVHHLLPEGQQITRIVYHNWYSDEFSKGAWSYFKPDFASKYLKALQEPFGPILFYSSDWSDGWRGWIDGAVQQGTQAAKVAIQELDSTAVAHL